MARERTLDHPRVIAPPPLIFLLPFLAGWLLHRRPLQPLPRRASRIAAAFLLPFGMALSLWAVFTFERAHTPVEPYRLVRRLVTWGPYRYSRNPIYASMTILYLGATALVDSLWPLVLLPLALVVVSRGVIAREEQYLERRFGDEYRTYARHVRRWL